MYQQICQHPSDVFISPIGWPANNIGQLEIAAIYFTDPCPDNITKVSTTFSLFLALYKCHILMHTYTQAENSQNVCKLACSVTNTYTQLYAFMRMIQLLCPNYNCKYTQTHAYIQIHANIYMHTNMQNNYSSKSEETSIVRWTQY